MTDDLDWKLGGLCAQTDPEVFFPEKGGSTREAKKICGGCEVRAECLEYALAHDERFGIWGGLSEQERRRLRRGQPAQRTSCAQGHLLAGDNVELTDRGRRCRICLEAANERRRERVRSWRARQHAARAAA